MVKEKKTDIRLKSDVRKSCEFRQVITPIRLWLGAWRRCRRLRG